jgi:hypothetical protein
VRALHADVARENLKFERHANIHANIMEKLILGFMTEAKQWMLPASEKGKSRLLLVISWLTYLR